MTTTQSAQGPSKIEVLDAAIDAQIAAFAAYREAVGDIAKATSAGPPPRWPGRPRGATADTIMAHVR